MTRRDLARLLGGPAAAAMVCLASAGARADAPVAKAAPPSATVEIDPALSLPTGAEKLLPPGWNEVLIRVQDRQGRALRGQARVTVHKYVRDAVEVTATAPFAVPPHGAVSLLLPIEVQTDASVNVDVRDDDGRLLGEATLQPLRLSNVIVADLSDPPSLRPSIGGAGVSTNLLAPPYLRHGASGGVSVAVTAPHVDPVSGDPILPDRAAAYGPVDAVIARSDLLVKLGRAEIDALAAYVLAGGTLAIAITRPEDLQSPTIQAFAGGAITKQAPSAEALRNLMPGSPGPGDGAHATPWALNANEATQKTLVGFGGGNLHGSPYGSSAAYGLGEVHLLAFDPTSRPASEDQWALGRVIDVARRGYDRRAALALRSPRDANGFDATQVRKQLDPNENSGWSIAVAALILCIYALLAGPLNYSRAGKSGKPLRALVRLPLFALVAFAAVVGVGVASKGVRGRARRLTLVEAGAGMTVGTARRFRGFFSPRSDRFVVRATDRASVVTMSNDDGGAQRERLVVDREGTRLVDVAALPWQTLVVREEGTASLGEGISITADDAEVDVTNRSGRNLRGAILRLPSGKFIYLGNVADGAKASSRSAPHVDATTAGATWVRNVEGTHATKTPGVLAPHRLDADELGGVLDADAPGLAHAWEAIEATGGGDVDWFPDGAPVLIGQLDGGEGKRTDAGLRVESDRLLVRVLGFGGRK
ncbi:MAG TPA: hypothetical protein VGM56_05440 [Byssovorax sp.]|jgi:hypothetical protein|nr:hypothetical protein [Polyangia bacterium]